MVRRYTDRLATACLWFAGLLIIGILAWLLWRIMSAGLPHVSWHFLTGQPSAMTAGGGVAPELFNSFYVLVLSVLIAAPLGIGAGIFLAEYARPSRGTDLIRLSVESLASVPSIVFGLFGMLVFVQLLHLRFTIIGGSISLALLNLPVLVRVTEESLRTVPQAHRDGSYALGSTKWQTIRKVLLPSALPGLITGITLVAGRALGETAVLVFTAGMSVSRYPGDFNLFASGETLSVHLYAMLADGLVPDAQQIAAASGAVLVFVVLIFNLLVAIPGRILQRKLTGKD